ncbi:GyrI-like domain-containing protein, partial [Streptococcus hyointestinalis]
LVINELVALDLTSGVLNALEKVKIKKPNSLYEQISFSTMQDGKSIEILHVGTYDNEPISFQKMNLFAKENALVRSTDFHREIYLNNANRVLKSKLKTVLRYSVK